MIEQDGAQQEEKIELMIISAEKVEEKIHIGLQGGTVIFEEHEVPGDLLEDKDAYYVVETQTGEGPVKKASYAFLKKN